MSHGGRREPQRPRWPARIGRSRREVAGGLLRIVLALRPWRRASRIERIAHHAQSHSHEARERLTDRIRTEAAGTHTIERIHAWQLVQNRVHEHTRIETFRSDASERLVPSLVFASSTPPEDRPVPQPRAWTPVAMPVAAPRAFERPADGSSRQTEDSAVPGRFPSPASQVEEIAMPRRFQRSAAIDRHPAEPNLDSLTDQVLQRIERRAVAQRERLGRF